MTKGTEVHYDQEVKVERIQVFVRKGSHPGTRLVSFQRPSDAYLDSLIDKDVLPMGLAFDGNSISVEVTPRTRVTTFTPSEDPLQTMQAFISEGDQERSLTKALNEVQFAIREWLMRIGWKAASHPAQPAVHVYFT